MTAPALTGCATAACRQTATTVMDGWPMCQQHAEPEKPERPWHAYETLRQWVGRLHHVGLTDAEIAGVVGVSPCTARDHRRRLGLPTNRTALQLAHDARLAREGDARVSRCQCTRWRWDGLCGRCDRQKAAS